MDASMQTRKRRKPNITSIVKFIYDATDDWDGGGNMIGDVI